MFKKISILKYESILEEYPSTIVTSKTKIPDWYKKISKWNNNKILNNNNEFDPTVKQCMPFLDAMSLGYMITLPYDIYVKNDNGSPFLVWEEGVKNPPRWRPEPPNQNIVPQGFFPFEYVWSLPATIKINKKYSMLITHPLNRSDLPFYTLSGIVDGGWAVYENGSIPFYIKKDFEGMIEQGTPIAQIIPFKRENWIAKNTRGLSKEGKLNQSKRNLKIYGWYKNTFWIKKTYS